MDESALNTIYMYSQGFPGLAHELGYWAFENDDDGEIDIKDVIQGIMGNASNKGALENIYDKHFRTTLTKGLRSDVYREILKVFADAQGEVLNVGELAEKSTVPRTKVGSYLGQLVQRGVIKRVDGQRGQYMLSSRLLGVWLMLNDVRQSAGRTR
jgi:hypothetical protein